MADFRQTGEYTAQARVFICARLASGRLTAPLLAKEMAVSTRTLQRRLATEHTSFSALLEEVRRECALAALPMNKLSCEEMAEKLGYNQQSTFTRAVRRWTGKPPTALRG